MRRALPLAILALAVAAGPAQAATSVQRYNPWDDLGNPKLNRYVHGAGECTQASRISSRADAWRCVSGTTTFDPCFASTTGDDEVFCVRAPWSRTGHLLGALLEPDTHGNSPAPDAWALRVRNRRCTYAPGLRRGRTYRCGRRSFLFGRPKRNRPNWTIRIGPNRRAARRARVRTAWT
jgi:hypothetical protein